MSVAQLVRMFTPNNGCVALEQRKSFEQEHAIIPSIAGLPQIIRAFVR